MNQNNEIAKQLQKKREYSSRKTAGYGALYGMISTMKINYADFDLSDT